MNFLVIPLCVVMIAEVGEVLVKNLDVHYDQICALFYFNLTVHIS